VIALPSEQASKTPARRCVTLTMRLPPPTPDVPPTPWRRRLTLSIVGRAARHCRVTGPANFGTMRTMGASGSVVASDGLLPYVPRLLRGWGPSDRDDRHTRVTGRLVFAELLTGAYDDGADLVKWAVTRCCCCSADQTTPHERRGLHFGCAHGYAS
jgi:hypothetical protein